MGTLSDYVGSGFCEMTADTGPRDHYDPLIARFDEFDFGGLDRGHISSRVSSADRGSPSRSTARMKEWRGPGPST